MAEGFANKLSAGRLRAWSAGLFPLGWIEKNTSLVMNEVDITLAGQSSKGMAEVPLEQMDVVVAMGTEVSFDLPSCGGKSRVIPWQIPDPFGSSLDRYRAVRALIEVEVRNLIADLTSG